jgi:hypothetical protein
MNNKEIASQWAGLLGRRRGKRPDLAPQFFQPLQFKTKIWGGKAVFG